MRRTRAVETIPHDRWLVSYADFITLLFAFFVVLFASSETSKTKARKMSASVEKAFGHRVVLQTPSPLAAAPSPKVDPAFADLTPSIRFLEQQLSEELRTGKMNLSLQARGLVITLGEAAFFPAGEDRIQPDAFQSLEKVAAALNKIPNPIRLEGHSDSVPIHSARFSSNWDLSAARAVQTLKTLEERYGVSSRRLSAAGYADTAPVQPNDTEAGRSRNRRVDLVILTRNGSAQEPAPR